MAEVADVAIVGGGISGLALAYYLERADLNPLIIERDTVVGGYAQSKRVEGFLLDLAPNSTIAHPTLLTLIAELGLSSNVVFPSTAAKQKFLGIRTHDRLSLLPAPRSFLEFVASPLMTAAEKCRIFAEPFVRKGGLEDESVQSFITRRFGTGMCRLYATLLGGIYAADISKLSARSALPHVWGPEQKSGSISVGSILHRREFQRPRTFLSFAEGMGSFPALLASKLKRTKFILDSDIVRIEPTDDEVRLTYVSNIPGSDSTQHTLSATACCTTVSPKRVSAILGTTLDEQLSRSLQLLPFAPVGIVHLAVAEDSLSQPLSGFGALIPPTDPSPLLGVIFSSVVFPGRAAPGEQLLTCFAGGCMKPELADVTRNEVSQKIALEVSQLLGLKKPPRILQSTYYADAIPNYPLGHFELQERVSRFHQCHPRVRLLGSWIRGLSFADRVEQAKLTAADLIQLAHTWKADSRRSPADPPHQSGSR